MSCRKRNPRRRKNVEKTKIRVELRPMLIFLPSRCGVLLGCHISKNFYVKMKCLEHKTYNLQIFTTAALLLYWHLGAKY